MIPRYYSWILLLATLFAPYPCHSLAPLNPRGQLNGNSRSFPDGAKKTKLSSSSTAALTASEEGASKPASISAATFNVIKACVGSGVLALPAGLALLTDRPQATIPASLLIVAIGGLSAYTFFTLGRLCHERNKSSLGELWTDLVGPSWIVDMCTFLMTLGICLSYSIIIGDFASALSRVDRRICILGITASCLYPLSRLPSLDALAPVSKASIIGVLVTCGVMVYQWSVSSVTSRIVTASGALAPSTNPLTALVLMSMAATSYVCHFSAPEFLESTNRQMDQYKKVTIFGFSTVALINIIILCAGFLTFGRNSAGIILNSYPVSDPLAGLCRLLMLISIIGGYPILLKGTTSALYSLIGTKQKTEGGSARAVSRSVHHAVTVALLTILTLASLVLENAGFVVGFNGATMGSAITYIFPSLMAIKASQRRGESPGWGNRLILGFGVLSAIAGGTVSVLSAFAPHMLQ